MMARTLFLARHGETDWNRAGRWQGHSDVSLNDLGRQQARELAEALRAHGIARVCTSDLSRAHETARIIAERLAIGEVLVDAGLRERCFGVFEGLTATECSERFPEHWQVYSSELRIPPPGAEAQLAVGARVREAVLRLVDGSLAQESGAVLMVSHGAAIRAFVLSITGSLLPPLGNTATVRLRVDRGGFSDVELLR